MIESSFADRFNEALEESPLNASKLSQMTKLQQSTLSNYKKGKSVPNFPTIERLASFLEVNPKWLESGDGPKKMETNQGADSSLELGEEFSNSNGNRFIKLPNGQFYMLMPLAEFSIQAGFLDHYQDTQFLLEMGQHGMLVDKPVQGRYIAFRVDGDSMDDGSYDAIKRNSIVSTRELQRHHWRDKIRYKDFPYWVIYTSQSKFPLLKEIISHDVDNGTITCHSLNPSPEFSDFELNLNDVSALFYVFDVTKGVSNKIIY